MNEEVREDDSLTFFDKLVLALVLYFYGWMVLCLGASFWLSIQVPITRSELGLIEQVSGVIESNTIALLFSGMFCIGSLIKLIGKEYKGFWHAWFLALVLLCSSDANTYVRVKLYEEALDKGGNKMPVVEFFKTPLLIGKEVKLNKLKGQYMLKARGLSSSKT